jgi:DnaJ-class molecular chaperone
VRGPDDAWLEVEVAPGTQSGQVFRLRGKGMPRLAGGRGDLYVLARVETPCDLDAGARELLRELAARLPSLPRERETRAAP